MRADPEPENRVVDSRSQSAPSEANADSIDRFCGVDLLELQARMSGIVLPDAIRLPGLPLNILRKALKCISESLSGVRNHCRHLSALCFLA